MIVIVGSANAVNLTDGLDGLAIMPVMIAAGALGVIAYAVGRVDFTEYLDVHYVNGTGEILILCSGIFGAGLGFSGIMHHQLPFLWAIQGLWRSGGSRCSCRCYET